ncbi:unnamed protein product, partial [Iphiclides podalirius]
MCKKSDENNVSRSKLPVDARLMSDATTQYASYITLLFQYSRQDGGEWGEGAQLARCCRRVEFGAIAN